MRCMVSKNLFLVYALSLPSVDRTSADTLSHWLFCWVTGIVRCYLKNCCPDQCKELSPVLSSGIFHERRS